MPQLGFYRYTDDFEANLISTTQSIGPAPHQSCKWYTPNDSTPAPMHSGTLRSHTRPRTVSAQFQRMSFQTLITSDCVW